MDVGLQKYCGVENPRANKKWLLGWIRITFALWFTARTGDLVVSPDSSGEESYVTEEGAEAKSGEGAKAKAEGDKTGTGAVLLVWVLSRCGVGGR